MKKIFATIAIILCPNLLSAHTGTMLLLDAHTTAYIEEIAQPLLKTANIPDKNIKFYVTADKSINAFVTGENVMYIHAGLILKAKRPEELIGVIAHELGHIEGHHLMAMRLNQDKITLPTIISSVLGVGAAAAGAPTAGTALIMAGQAATIDNILRHTRTNEREADQRAFRILHEAGYSVEPFATFFDTLRGQELLYSQKPPEYLLTHPYSQSRKDAALNYITRKEGKLFTPKTEDINNFKLVQARLFAALNSPMTTMRKFQDDNTITGIYAKAIALSLSGQLDKALILAKQLTNKAPTFAYFAELQGYILAETGDLSQGITFYEKALNLAPNNAFLRIQLARYLINNNHAESAIPHLQRVIIQRNKWSEPYHLLGIAYGKSQKLAHSHTTLAEEALLKGSVSDAKLHLTMAEKELKTTPNTQLNEKIKHIRAIISAN